MRCRCCTHPNTILEQGRVQDHGRCPWRSMTRFKWRVIDGGVRSIKQAQASV